MSAIHHRNFWLIRLSLAVGMLLVGLSHSSLSASAAPPPICMGNCKTADECDKDANDNPQAVITKQTTIDCKAEGMICCVVESEYSGPAATQEAPAATPKAGPAPAQANSYGFPDLLQGAKIPELVNRLVYATLSIVGALFFVMFLWGGVMYLTAGGTADRVKKATQTLTNAVIGLVIVAFSYMLVTFVINTIVTGKEGNTESQTPATSYSAPRSETA